MWKEIKVVIDENKRELCLSGKEINDRIKKDGGVLTKDIFTLININLLRISEVELADLSENIGQLKNLQTLILYGNKLKALPSTVGQLEKLKFLDISSNCLEELPASLNRLTHLTTLNVANNKLTEVVKLNALTKLIVLDISRNSIQNIDSVCEMHGITTLKASLNQIERFPAEFSKLAHLKELDLSKNQITQVPITLAQMSKLKDLDLLDNPIADKRLLKLIKQCKTKSVLDYVKTNGTKLTDLTKALKDLQLTNVDGTKMGAPVTGGEQATVPVAQKKILVEKYTADSLHVVYHESVREIRQFILCCVFKNVNLAAGNVFKHFIQVQRDLHKNVCGQRRLSTLATHDLRKIHGNAQYCAKPPAEIKISPLGDIKCYTAKEYYRNLKAAAEVSRKEQKRNTYSSLHKHLHLLEGLQQFPILEDSQGNCLSLHPLTNSENSKIEETTKDIFVEVTSSTNLKSVYQAMEELIQKTLDLNISNREGDDIENTRLLQFLRIQQVKIVKPDGSLYNVYPNRMDLSFNLSNISVERCD